MVTTRCVINETYSHVNIELSIHAKTHYIDEMPSVHIRSHIHYTGPKLRFPTCPSCLPKHDISYTYLVDDRVKFHANT